MKLAHRVDVRNRSQGATIHNQIHTFIIGKANYVKKLGCVGVGLCGGAQLSNCELTSERFDTPRADFDVQDGSGT